MGRVLVERLYGTRSDEVLSCMDVGKVYHIFEEQARSNLQNFGSRSSLQFS